MLPWPKTKKKGRQVSTPKPILSKSSDCSSIFMNTTSKRKPSIAGSTATAAKTEQPSLPPTRFSSDTIIAYVQQLSPPTCNKNCTVDFSTLLLQTKDNPVQEALLYSKHKRPLFADSEKCRTPLKIKQFTLTPDRQKLIINDMTKISVPGPNEYSFQFEEFVPQESQPLSIEDILNGSDEWDNITFRSKVVYLPVDLWEEHNPMIEKGKIYRITPIQVRSWAGKKMLSTTRRSVIATVEDGRLSKVLVSEEHLKLDRDSVLVKVLDILSVQSLKTFIKCFNKCFNKRCSRRLLQP